MDMPVFGRAASLKLRQLKDQAMKTPGELFADRLEDIELTADKARRAATREFDVLIAQINAAEVSAIDAARAELRAATTVSVPRDDGQMIDFAVGQYWTHGSTSISEFGKRIVEIQQRQSTTFLKTTGLHGGKETWESAGLMIAWIDATNSILKET